MRYEMEDRLAEGDGVALFNGDEDATEPVPMRLAGRPERRRSGVEITGEPIERERSPPRDCGACCCEGTADCEDAGDAMGSGLRPETAAEWNIETCRFSPGEWADRISGEVLVARSERSGGRVIEGDAGREKPDRESGRIDDRLEDAGDG